MSPIASVLILYIVVQHVCIKSLSNEMNRLYGIGSFMNGLALDTNPICLQVIHRENISVQK